MAIEHNVIADPEIHEPKDVSTANINETYIADGAGSGSWGKVTGTNTVFVKTMADFPAAVAGVRTLITKTMYVITADLTTADRFVMAEGVTMEGQSTSGVTLTYTGTATMFTGIDISCFFVRMRLSCATAQAFDMSDSTGGLRNFSFINSVLLAATSFGTFDDLSVATFSGSGTGLLTQGFSFVGTNWNIISFINFGMVSTSASFIGVDLGSAISPRINLTNLIVTGPAGSAGVSGLASSGNVPVGSIANITNCLFKGGMTTPLVNIDSESVRWDLANNSANVPDTMPDAMVALTTNATNTVIAGAGTAVLVAGTWTDERSSHYTVTAAGRITYIGEKPLTTPVDVIMNMEPVSGTNKNLSVQIFHNGTLLTGTKMQGLTNSGDALGFTSMWQLQMVQNDYLEVFVSNETDTVDINVNDAIFRVR